MGDATASASASTKTAELDAPLSALGFEIEEVSPSRLTGRLVVTDTCCQVWEVKLWKMDVSTQGEGPQIAEARVTLLCNLPVPDEMKSAGESLRKYSKL
ncbi:hypothetical protein CFC21_056263 [Triticum aestivum]|uniref:Uncharacterized protein n=2 Tax=Triticum aestivum TaxID=4565 RepID=A0A9R1GHT0_WHEAT|nr:hypothetical protein CFC21_056263 [Triticum aestivum]